MARISTRTLLRSGRLTHFKLTAGQGLLLVVLADHADKTGLSFLSQESLAHESGMSRAGVRKALERLVAAGLVEVVDPGGPRRSARLRLTIPALLPATELPVSRPSYGQKKGP